MRILQGFFKGVQKGFRKGHLEGFIRVLQGFFRLKNSEKGSARACSRDSRFSGSLKDSMRVLQGLFKGVLDGPTLFFCKEPVYGFNSQHSGRSPKPELNPQRPKPGITVTPPPPSPEPNPKPHKP